MRNNRLYTIYIDIFFFLLLLPIYILRIIYCLFIPEPKEFFTNLLNNNLTKKASTSRFIGTIFLIWHLVTVNIRVFLCGDRNLTSDEWYFHGVYDTGTRLSCDWCAKPFYIEKNLKGSSQCTNE